MSGESTYAAFVVSFVMVGIFWANHHYMFHYANRSNTERSNAKS